MIAFELKFVNITEMSPQNFCPVVPRPHEYVKIISNTYTLLQIIIQRLVLEMALASESITTLLKNFQPIDKEKIRSLLHTKHLLFTIFRSKINDLAIFREHNNCGTSFFVSSKVFMRPIKDQNIKTQGCQIFF